jgi:hypothetical protein
MAESFKALLPAQTAGGATSVTEIGLVSTTTGTDNTVSRIELVPPAVYTTSTADATNNVTFNVRRNRGGTNVTLGSFTTTATSLVAETPVNVPITGTQANTTSLQQDDLIECQMVQNGTGVAVGANVLCEIEIS